ncbi:MAG: low molecular weight phosphotyrosine protein phosphatase [Leptospiraceae bacterium]|nr:low molecular weight phosphotyrosine protein phosphatase [Leptospiraceae bacterium]
MMKKIKVLFVCLGNICRSPAGQGALQKLVYDSNLNHIFEIDSCGTAGYHIGSLPDPRTRKVAEREGIQLTHQARKFNPSKDFEEFDYIFAMDDSNFDNILNLAWEPWQKEKVAMFRYYDDQQKDGLNVPDPYYGTIKDFELVQEIVTRTSKGFINFLKSKGILT